MASPPSPSSERILLVEGQDDEHVIRHLRERHQLQLTFCIRDKKGFPNLRPSISSEIKAPGRLVVGILVDANDNLDNRWRAVTNELRKANIQAPMSPDPTGTIIDSKPRIGIWLMPDNIAAGELENFVIQMIPDSDPVWPRAQRYIDEIPEAEREFLDGKTQRAQLHAWLAARKNPRKMGSAIGSCDLNISGTLCQNIIAWLTKLFA